MREEIGEIEVYKVITSSQDTMNCSCERDLKPRPLRAEGDVIRDEGK